MKKLGWQAVFGGILIVLSILFYTLHFCIFRDAHHIWIYLLGDIAFIPIEVLVVTMIIHQLLVRQEKKGLRNKMNMVIGVFFSETGNDLLRRLTELTGKAQELQGFLRPGPNWSAQDYRNALRQALALDPEVCCARVDLPGLQTFLLKEREHLMRLLENPNLMEHEAFTDVLWSVVHLSEELAARNLAVPPTGADARHLEGDIRRAYERLLTAWIEYILHLREAYPYLFSLALRQNPFDATASAVVV